MCKTIAGLSLAAMLAGLPLSAQLSEKPESWAQLEGHALVEPDVEQVSMLMYLARGAAQRAAMGATRRPAAYELLRLGFAAYQAQNWTFALRLLSRGLAIDQGLTPGEWLDVATSLQIQLDRRVLAPGALYHVRLQPQFTLERPLPDLYSVRLSLLDSSGKPLQELKKFRLETLDIAEFTLSTAGLADGEYSVLYQLTDRTGKVFVEAARALTVSSSLSGRLKALQQQSEKLALSGVGQRSPRHALAMQSLTAIGRLYERARREGVDGFQAQTLPIVSLLSAARPPFYSSDPIRPERDLPLAERMASALLAGGDPLAGERGDLRLALRSPQDGSLQPFRLFVPDRYTTEKKWPLVVLLHGLGGDEGSYFERVPEVKRLAAERGYLLLAPHGRTAVGDYSGLAAEDVFDLIETLKHCYSIDASHVFVSGHGSGGGGAIALSLQPRALDGGPLFAALAAVGGVPIQALNYAKAAPVPLLQLQAENDRVYVTAESRKMAFVLERRFKPFEYAELPGESESSVAAASARRVFDFFEAVRKGEWKPSGIPVPVTPLQP